MKENNKICNHCKFYDKKFKKCFFLDFMNEMKISIKLVFDEKNNTCNKFHKENDN